MLEFLKKYKATAFFALWVLVALAGLFGFAGYEPPPDLAQLVTLVVSFLASLLAWFGERKP